jgi:polar amino acid transport system substrate-binding protein
MLRKLLLSLVCLATFASAASAAEKVIVFASDATWPPMEFVNEQKQIVGFSVELLAAMGKAAGFKPEIKNVAWDGIFAGLTAKKYDAISSSVSITDERKNTMDFSDPYFEVKQGVVVQKGSPAKTAADLKGKTVGAQIGTTGFFAAKKIEGATPKSYDEIGLAIEDLYSGRLDAVICDDAIAANYALQHPQYSQKLALAFLLKSDTPEYLGFAFPKGDKDNIALVNKGLKMVKESGEYDKIVAKWFGSK